MNLEELLKFSREKAVLRSLLFFISIIYTFLVDLRLLLYKLKFLKTKTSLLPVISVGNLTVGGTGKTPLVIALSKYFQRNKNFSDKKIFVLSRGYKSKNAKKKFSSRIEALDTDSDPFFYGDEAVLIKNSLRNYPQIEVFSTSKRVKLIESLEKQSLLSSSSQNSKNKKALIILDDGFQYLKLERDLNICLLDCSDSYFQWVFPRGSSRESFKQVKRADLFCLTRLKLQTKSNQEKIYELLRKYNKEAPIYHLSEKLTLQEPFLERSASPKLANPVNLKSLQKMKLGAFCGLGNSSQFFEMLREELNLRKELKKVLSFPDHYSYTSLDLQKISLIEGEMSLDYWITTEKDFVKIKNLSFKLKNLLLAKLELIIPEPLANLLRSFD